ncbi:hypothetical protein QCM80_00935 [Bradyrhizobium sp. SSUT112]|uniref:hypothetical protein n=1 Tax=Bradyrhizobium sp. SSUT112 TaxID=3040604 RepID=UPI00244B5BE6|nr:hypothetical protein [Bradyrhizobium sp. SSUT112]MDH2349253.1 hypothetical protein [Bradyrhizobium sp. SSUT112]
MGRLFAKLAATIKPAISLRLGVGLATSLVTADTRSKIGLIGIPDGIGSGVPGVVASTLAGTVAAMVSGVTRRGREQKKSDRKRCDGAGRSNVMFEFVHGSLAEFGRRLKICDGLPISSPAATVTPS